MTANLSMVVRSQSKLKTAFIALFAAGLTAGMWAMFFHGFVFLNRMGGVGLLVTHRLFGMFYFGMGVMLAISSMITSYTTLFRSDEIPFLLLYPISHARIAVHKLVDSAGISSWAFFFIAIPFIGAFAQHEKMSPFFILWTVVFSLPYVLFYSGMGTLVVLVFIRWVPRARVVFSVAGLIVVIAAVYVYLDARSAVREQDETVFIITRLLPGMRIVSNPLWPSSWVANGIDAMSRGNRIRGMMFFNVLIANTVLVFAAAGWLGKHVFYEAWQKTLNNNAVKRKKTLFPLLDRLMGVFPSDARGIIMKDLRVFCRDPAQWAQGILFFGLLGFYFFNIRSFRYHMLPPIWRNTIAFLNLFSLSAVMCSFCSRFVYPQLSLEGQGFWIIGLSPSTMQRVLVTKFCAAVVCMLPLSCGLMFISTHMLMVEPLVRAATLGISAATTFALCGFGVGLGAVFMNLKQSNPSAIISGFGGTLNLVLSLGFMILVITPFGMMFHMYYTDALSMAALKSSLPVLWVVLVLVTLASVVVPLYIAVHSLENRDY